ncbi:MAG: protein kinase [Blastocatellales bacterium]
MLNDQQKQRVRDVFEIVAEGESDDRMRLLDEACQGDEEVRRQVEELLGLLPKAGEFLETPAMSDPEIFREITGSLAQGRRIGNYEILEEIGHGGMGAVFLAVRADEDFRNQVAIKLVWPIFDNQEVISRFRQERRILADLSHQNIAHLIDGGTTEEGWPYLVMEYIDGVPITRYCDRLSLSVTDRLKLFRQVCDAVSYAHGHQEIWDVATGLETASLKAHSNQIYSIAFSPDGDTLASGSWDRTARLYRASSGEEIERKIRFRNLFR